MKKYLIVATALTIMSFYAYSEEEPREYKYYTSNKMTIATIDFGKYIDKYGFDSIDEIIKYTKDPENMKRSVAINKLCRLSEGTDDIAKKYLVSELLAASVDDIYTQDQIRDHFEKYPQYVSENAKIKIIEVFDRVINNPAPSLKTIIELFGIANVRDGIPRLRKIVDDGNNEIKHYNERIEEEKKKVYWEDLAPYLRGANEREAARKKVTAQGQRPMIDKPRIEYFWTARKALARMGSEEDIRSYIEMLEAEYTNSVNEKIAICPSWCFYREKLKWFLDLTYIRQPQTVAILIDFLNSDKEFDSGIAGQTTRYDYRAASYLSSCIMGYPVLPKFGLTSYQKKEVETCREWMKENYSPHKIKSLSVLIDGKIYDNINDGEPLDLKTNPIFNQSTEFKTDTPTENVKENPKPEKKDNNIPNP